jgi:hypothetical protein
LRFGAELSIDDWFLFLERSKCWKNGDCCKGEFRNSPLQVIWLATAAAGTGTPTARLAATALPTTRPRSGFAATLTAARLTTLFTLLVIFVLVFVLIRHFFLLDLSAIGLFSQSVFYSGANRYS